MSAVLEIEQTAPRRLAATAESTRAAATASLAIPVDLLDGGEIVLLAIKPALWFVLFDAVRWLIVGALLLAAAATWSFPLPGLSAAMVAQLAGVVMCVRLGVALARWVSRFYVLTNRRIMRICGVLRADVQSCPLLKIRNTRVSAGLHERLTRLGTLHFVVDPTFPPDLCWAHVARAEEVHDRVRRAIERAIDNTPHL